MPYDVYQSHPPQISTWVIDDYTELAEVLRVIQTDQEHSYWFNRTYSEPDSQAPLQPALLQVSLNPEDPLLYFEEPYQSSAGRQKVAVATGSCCVTTSSNGSAYVSMYPLPPWALPAFLFNPELRPLI